MRVLPVLTFLALLSARPSSGQTPAWTQFPGSPGSTTRHDDIWFVDEAHGWSARGTDGIYRTTDGGGTWVKVLTNAATHFRSIGFASATRGWAGNLGPGSYDASVTDTNVLYETFDGGQSWSIVPGINEPGMRGLCAMHVLDAQHIYGGGRVRGPAYFIKTTDGGASWTVTNLTAAGVMGAIMDVYFKDATNGFLVGMDTNAYAAGCGNVYHGRITRTTDGGETWTPVVTTSLSCCYFWKMSWPTPQIGYASLQQNGSHTNIVFYKTTDGGSIWVSNGIPFSAVGVSSFFFQAIGFANASEGWMGGDTSGTYSNTFLHTTNGGANWTRVGYNNTQRINRIRFAGPTLGYAAGSKLHVYRVPLAITNQPQSQWVSAGVNVTLSVGVSGNPPFSYQWLKDGVNIPDATNAAFTLADVVRSNSASYSVAVTNAWGSLTSSNAVLRVVVPQWLQPPEIAGGTAHILFGDADGGPLSTNDLDHFEVLASTNLFDWVTLTNALSLTNGMMLLEDALAYPQRFYRVLEH